jgi:outer membrane biosynthesis protein TonB
LHCFTRELATRPELNGHVDAEVVIGTDGRIVEADVVESTIADDQKIRECLFATLRGWQFARRSEAAPARVRFPWESGVELATTSAPQGHGSLGKEMIRLVIRLHLYEVCSCYEQLLRANPTLQGRIMTQFTIAADGRVAMSLTQSSTLNAPELDRCINGIVEGWRFPRPAGGGIVIVSYPFVLKLAD